MSIEVNKDFLYDSISTVDSLIPSRSVNVLLSNCYFKVSEDEIEIVSTDNEIGIRTKIKAVSDTEIAFTANGSRFSSLLKEMPKGSVIIDVKDSFVLNIKSKSSEIRGEYKLIGTSGENYPEVPAFYKETAVEIQQKELKSMIKKVIYAAATDTIKPVFNGIYVTTDPSGKITLVATDSRRLSIISRNIDSEINKNEGVIIPLKAVHEVYKLLDNDGTLQFSIKNNQCFFKVGKTELVSRIIDGQYPNFKQVIPQERNIKADVNRNKCLESLRRAMIFTGEPVRKISLIFKKDMLMIEARTAELGECIEEIQIESNVSEDIAIGLNSQFLLESIREMDSETITFGITSQMSPVVITPENDPGFISVIMPIKLKSHEDD